MWSTIQFPVAVLYGKGDTALFYRDIALKTIKHYFQKRWPQNVLKYVKLLRDNVQLQKVTNVTL